MNDGLRRGDPRLALIDVLTRIHAEHPLDRCARIASAWNAWFRGRTLEFVRPVSAGKVGITFLGTRFKAEASQRSPANSSAAAASDRRDDAMPLAAASEA